MVQFAGVDASFINQFSQQFNPLAGKLAILIIPCNSALRQVEIANSCD
jgi:hypothetical protein